MTPDIIQSVTGGEWLVPPVESLDIRSVTDDSRQVDSNTAFIAVPGERRDGHEFLGTAARAGTPLLIISSPSIPQLPPPLRTPQPAVLRVANTLAAYHDLARAHRRSLAGGCVAGILPPWGALGLPVRRTQTDHGPERLVRLPPLEGETPVEPGLPGAAQGDFRPPVRQEYFAAQPPQSPDGLVVIGLTGSCGKTSAKEMLRAILEMHAPGAVLATEGNLNNHFGVPRTLFRLAPHHRFAIVEMGSNQPGDIAQLTRMVEPDMGLITSIGHAHLERLGSLAGVAREKAALFAGLPEGGIAVMPADGPESDALRQAAAERPVHAFGTEASGDVVARYDGWDGEAFRIALIDAEAGESTTVRWKVGGRHQARNAAGAVAVALTLGIPLGTACRGLESTRLPGMRMDVRRDDNSVLWVNDAYNANPDSMRAGLELFAEIATAEKRTLTTLVLGDMLELGDWAEHAHADLLDWVCARFPDAHLIPVGHAMTAAAEERGIPAFPDTATARPVVRAAARPGTAIFLKASRTIALEHLLPR